ncbi:MAG: SDR family oxidoreductase [Pseudomonadota bacterium]
MDRGVCIVTGGSRGIGAAACRKIAAAGWNVLVNYNANEAAATGVVEAIRAAGGSAEPIGADVSTEEGILKTFGAADAMGRLTAVVTNAGVGDLVGDVEGFSYARVERLMRLNVTSVIICCREAVKRMARKNGGSGGAIVNLSSAAAKLGAPHQFVDYAATKGAIDTFTVGLALEWAKEGIRVNAVRPGVIDTEFHASVGVPNRPTEVGPGLPMGRAGTADEVAETILWLMSDGSSYSTGAIIDVSGGRSIVP